MLHGTGQFGRKLLTLFAMMKREFPGPMLFGKIVYERHVSERRCWKAKTISLSFCLRYFLFTLRMVSRCVGLDVSSYIISPTFIKGYSFIVHLFFFRPMSLYISFFSFSTVIICHPFR